MLRAFTRPAINGGGRTVTRTTTATPTATRTASPAPTSVAQRTIIEPGSAWKAPVYGTIHVPVKRDIVSETGPLTLPGPAYPDRLPDIDPGSPYSMRQIREMLERGRSADEINERSGEPDAGLGPEYDLEQQARESGATSAFERDAGNTPPPPEAADDKRGLAWLAAAALGYFLLT